MHAAPPAPWALPDPSLPPFHGQRQQSVSVERDGRRLDFVAVLAQAGGSVTLVALSPLGQRLLRLTWDRQGVKSELDPALGTGFDPGQALRDLVFAAWPAAALQAALSGGPWSARFDADGGRTLLCQGRPRLRVSGSPATAAGQRLEHEPEGYSVTVKDLKETDD